MLLAFGTFVSGGFFHVSFLPKIEECKDKYPHQIDEMPIQARNLHGLVAPLPVEKPPPTPKTYHRKKTPPRRYVQAVETGDHEKRRSKLRRAQGIPPGTNSFPDELGPLERLHPNEGGAERCSDQH